MLNVVDSATPTTSPSSAPLSTETAARRQLALELCAEQICLDFARWREEEGYAPWQAALISLWRLQGRPINWEVLGTGMPN